MLMSCGRKRQQQVYTSFKLTVSVRPGSFDQDLIHFSSIQVESLLNRFIIKTKESLTKVEPQYELGISLSMLPSYYLQDFQI